MIPALYLGPDSLDAGKQEVVVEGEGAAYLRDNEPEDWEPPEAVHCADLVAVMRVMMMMMTCDSP